MNEQQPQQQAGQNVTPSPQPISWEYVKELLTDSSKFNALPLARQKEIAAWMADAPYRRKQ